MTAATDPSAPEGRLESTSVAHLLAEAWRDRRSGRLELRRGATEWRLHLEAGAPTAIEAADGEDRFAQILEDQRRLSASERQKVEALAAERGCPQASAVLGLRLLDAKELYQALRLATRIQIGELLDWRQGEFRWAPAEVGEKPAGKPFDVLGLLQEQLPRRWGTERLFEELMPEADRVGELTPRLRRVVERLAGHHAMARQLIEKLDGTTSFGRILGACAGDPMAASTLWVMIHAGLVRTARARQGAEAEALDLEVVVDCGGVAKAAVPNAPEQAPSAEAATNAPAESPKARALREEVEGMLGRLDELSHYEALGLETEAGAAEIKKAYFKAAKRYHPDALARLGVEEIRDDAARVFARIAEAFEVLSDADKKAVYDAGGDQLEQIDTARLAQAETSYRKGEILVRMGNFAGALEYLEPAVELWPDEPAYQAALGWALYKQPQSDAERAREHLEIARAQAPDDPTTLYRLGLVLRSVGDEATGEQCILRARELDPDVGD